MNLAITPPSPSLTTLLLIFPLLGIEKLTQIVVDGHFSKTATYFKSSEEMIRSFEAYPGSIEITCDIAAVTPAFDNDLGVVTAPISLAGWHKAVFERRQSTSRGICVNSTSCFTTR